MLPHVLYDIIFEYIDTSYDVYLADLAILKFNTQILKCCEKKKLALIKAREITLRRQKEKREKEDRIWEDEQKEERDKAKNLLEENERNEEERILKEQNEREQKETKFCEINQKRIFG